MRRNHLGIAFFLTLLLQSVSSPGQVVPESCQITRGNNELQVIRGDSRINLKLLGINSIRVSIRPDGHSSRRTPVMNPRLAEPEFTGGFVKANGRSGELGSSEIQVAVTCNPTLKLSFSDATTPGILEQTDPLSEAAEHEVTFLHDASENLYGMSGVSIHEVEGGLTRNGGAQVTAGAQGAAGAPWFFTARYGVLIDSDGGTFSTKADHLCFTGVSRNDVEYFVVTGDPMKVVSTMSRITGYPPMPPKWSLGFLNSQWGSSEAEVKEIAAKYREKQVPLDGFILDFDWKAWGEDHYGEWRWNSTSAPGSFSPDQFPDGANGVFGKEMAAQGIHLAGILKPRILLYKPGSTSEMLEAAAYAQTHNLWVSNQDPYKDYFTGRLARDLDFSKADTRSWYWHHLENTFDTGMTAWWNDEADNINNLQFLNMGRALYDGQRGHSNVRVWSINRNFYLGSQRFGYAEWSGDIKTGFLSMAQQRARMLATINAGEPHWSMDTGGFSGHPTPENYARWMEFAAFVPIDRVHGDHGEKRQPWVYGPVAEQAATKALRLRYSLLPYIYSYERRATETGIGIVRPLFWLFPDDAKLVNETTSWMFGDALLVSPIITQGETSHNVYLPAGIWYDYFHGTKLAGGKTVSYAANPDTWDDIPLFVRSGSMIASQQPQAYTDQAPVPEITLDVFANEQAARFTYYEDDGKTYDYEQGKYYRQAIEASTKGQITSLFLAKPSGSFHSPLRSYLVRVHRSDPMTEVLLNGVALARVSAIKIDDPRPDPGWSLGQDRFGPLVTIRIPAQQQTSLELR